MAKRIAQPGLFDEAPEPPAAKQWREVPQEVFLSWPEDMQLRYCMNRDLASAAERRNTQEQDAVFNRENEIVSMEGEVDTATWYVNRAAMYERELARLR